MFPVDPEAFRPQTVPLTESYADGSGGDYGKAYGPEDVVAASFRCATSASGSGTWCFAAGFEEEYKEIIGANGRICFSTSYVPVPIRLMLGTKSDEIAVRATWVMHEILNEFRAGRA
jgi:hypothetical protein